MPLNNRNLLSFMVFLFLAGCIEPYSPNLHGEAEEIYVVSGEVTSQEGYQMVTISKAAPIDKPMNIPVTGGVLSIEDDQGRVFNMEEFSAGNTGSGSISNSFMPVHHTGCISCCRMVKRSSLIMI